MSTKEQGTVLVTGGAGYIGSRLVPRLLDDGYNVRVFDVYLFGDEGLDEVQDHPNLEQVKGDLRDQAAMKTVVEGCDYVVHLISIANDPRSQLDPQLSKSINYDAFRPFVEACKQSGAQRFIYTSSTSVYGISDAPLVEEDHPQEPLSDYSKYKSLCEPILFQYQSNDFTTVAIRPGVVNGYSPRQRLELLVNRFTTEAVNLNKISVQGGGEMRPNSHIEDMVDLYRCLLRADAERIGGQSYNATNENYRVSEIAEIVRDLVQKRSGNAISLETAPVQDARSYAISSEKLKRELGFVCHRTVADSVNDLIDAFEAGKLPDSLTDARYYNIKTIQQLLFA